MKFSFLLKIFLLTVVLGVAGFFVAWEKPYLPVPLDSVPTSTPAINDELIVQEAKKVVSTPGPLRRYVESPKSFLRYEGVVAQTNEQRKDNGLPALVENAQLNGAAQQKVSDMFTRQYFEHVAPSGEGADTLAMKAGYTHIIIGENLAQGNFPDDSALVNAWMNSPGHRKNILDTRYLDIGVAVGQGTFNGRKTWLAVQIFALPLSSCPHPREEMRSTIDADKAFIDAREKSLSLLWEELESLKDRPDEYNKKVAEYNAIAEEINAKIDETKKRIAEYNDQVSALNRCIEQY